MFAVLYGDADAVRLLLDAGADPNTRNEAGATALMWAVDDADKTRLLLRRGADPNVKSDDGRTALLAATAGHPSAAVVRLLLDYGANPSHTVATYRGPVLIIHGTTDGIIPVAHARALGAAAAGATLHLLPCGHNDCPPQWEVVLSFLAANGVCRKPEQEPTHEQNHIC